MNKHSYPGKGQTKKEQSSLIKIIVKGELAIFSKKEWKTENRDLKEQKYILKVYRVITLMLLQDIWHHHSTHIKC